MKKWPLKIGAGILVGSAALLLAEAWFFSKYFFQVKRFSIGDVKSSKQLWMVLLTDLHFKKRLWPFHYRLAKKINALYPDLILIAGDLIDEHGHPEPAKQFLALLNHDTPIVAIPGNHDNKNNVSRQTLRKVVERHNGQLLANETTQLIVAGIPITITGLDDSIEGEGCFDDAVKDVGKEQHHLMLVHSPLQQEEAVKTMRRINGQRTPDQQLDIQYIFAGHTHGGQVRFKGYVPFLPEGAGNYVDGWYNAEKPFLYISKGFGTSAVPFRFGAKPEITLFTYGV